jgi:uncharacterized lipoprotein
MYREMNHGLVAGGAGRETHSIHPDDPLSAKMTTHWTEEMIRDDVHVRTETYSSMTSSRTHFHLTARIEAWLNDEMVFERDFTEDVERDLI